MRGKQTTWLVLIAAGFFAFIWLFERHTPGTASRTGGAPKLFPGFNPHLARSVELTASNLHLRAVRAADAWTLTQPVVYPAQSAPIEALLSALDDLTSQQQITARQVRGQSGGLAAFGLEPPQAVLRIEHTNHLELRLGSRTPPGDRIYLQVAGQPDIFTAGSNFFSQLPETSAVWRNPLLMHLSGLEFNRLEVRATGRGFAVERAGASLPWRLTRPMAARADNAKIENLLQQLRSWRAAEFVTDDPKADLERHGLRAPEMELAFGLGTNDALVLQFGKSSTNDPDRVYARRLQHTNVVLVPRAPLEKLRLPFGEYRDRRLATFESAAVESIEIRAEDSFALRRETNGSWRVIEPLNFAADAALVTNLLVLLGTIEVSEFVKDVVTDFGAYGLANPARRYTIRAGPANGGGALTNAGLISMDFSTNRDGTVFARRADEESVYAVPASTVARLPQALFQLRDRRVWDFSGSNVVAVTIKNAGRTRKLVRDAAREWVQAPEGAADAKASPLETAVNTLAVESLVDELGRLNALNWFARGAARKPSFGFNDGSYELTLDVAAGDNLRKYTVAFGGMTPSRRIFAAVELEGEPVIFEFPGQLFNDLAAHLTVPSAAAKP